MTASADSHVRRRSFDLLTPVVGVASLITFALHGVNGVLSRDLAIYAYAGQQFADGVPPYLGILSRTGPLAHALPAVGVVAARVGGFDELLGMRLWYLVIATACVCLVYLLARDLFTSRLAGLASAAAFLSFSGFIEYAADGPREKTPTLLFVVAALWALTRRRWFTAGLLLSSATLTLQLAFPAIAPALLVGLWAVARGRRLRALAGIVLGGLVPVVACLVYFTAAGGVHEALEGFLTINARYTAADPVTAHLARNWASVRSGYGVSTWIIVVGLAAILALSVWALFQRDRRGDPARVMTVAMGAATVSTIAVTSRDFDGWPDVMLLLPFAALGLGGVVRALEGRVPLRAAIAITLAWVVAAVSVAVAYSVTERDHSLVRQRTSVARVLASLPEGATIVAINAPQPLVLSGRTNPTRYLMLASGLDRYVDDTWPGGLAGFTDSIKRQRPTLIAVGRSRARWVSENFGAEYVRVARAPGWIWFVDRSVGPDVVSKLRR